MTYSIMPLSTMVLSDIMLCAIMLSVVASYLAADSSIKMRKNYNPIMLSSLC